MTSKPLSDINCIAFALAFDIVVMGIPGDRLTLHSVLLESSHLTENYLFDFAVRLRYVFYNETGIEIMHG